MALERRRDELCAAQQLTSEHTAADAPAGSSSATKYSAVDVACPEFERIVEELGKGASHKHMQQQLHLLLCICSCGSMFLLG